MRKWGFLTIFLGILFTASGQQPEQPYQWPADTTVRQKLEQWRDLKFGMIIHWGLYAVPGIVESWQLCSEDWIDRDSSMAYDDFKKWYWGLKEQFNPQQFNPDQWAEAGQKAGMKYLVFTTKHHDGFSMFDTKQSGFRITNGPFGNHPKADVARHVFDAFRKRNFMIGAYFSKPDWHSEYYWWPKYATADRNNNYDIRKYPWRWNSFKQFTYNQIQELVSNYGRMDILWLDGGWVRPKETVNAEVLSWGAPIPAWSQDINMASIAAMARKAQPGLLIVDRTVHGPFEDYRTPEQRIPADQLDYPWESCMTLGNAWGFVPADQYKSSTQVVHSLIEIVAKGGNLLLGIGPAADGTLPAEVVNRLSEIGDWVNKNGKAIYGTRPAAHYRDGNVFFTQSKDGGTAYVLACLPENGTIPATLGWKGRAPAQGSSIFWLETGEKVKWSVEGGTTRLVLPASLARSKKKHPALAFAMTPAVN